MVDVGFEVSIPSKLTVPVGKICKLVWLGARIFTVTFMTVTGFPALGPPRLAMLQITRFVLINPGTGASTCDRIAAAIWSGSYTRNSEHTVNIQREQQVVRLNAGSVLDRPCQTACLARIEACRHTVAGGRHRDLRRVGWRRRSGRRGGAVFLFERNG